MYVTEIQDILRMNGQLYKVNLCLKLRKLEAVSGGYVSIGRRAGGQGAGGQPTVGQVKKSLLFCHYVRLTTSKGFH